MKTAVVGCGNISRCHFSAVGKIGYSEISAAVDIVPDRAEAAALIYGGRAYTDYIKMLDEVKPDCVHICTPHYLHAQMSAEALKRGINVLCEKPIATSKKDLALIKAALDNSSAVFGVCLQNRYNESVRLAKEIILGEKYGKVICARASVQWNRDIAYYSDDWHGKKAKEGGGVLINQAIHTLDLLRYLLGEDMKFVTGNIFNEKFGGLIDVEDTVSARFESESGIISIFNATVGAGCDHPIMLEIVCENASVRIEGNSIYKVENSRFEEIFVDEESDFVGRKYWGSGHEALITDFYECIKTGREFPVGFSQAEKSVKELLAVYESSAENKRIRIE